ncbi:P-loop containing nucleoside triphosphate hydrolase protein [Podospora aff. communis PSN243]|uniref:P-loop containing nucleoside triphosphate hydrolase protein n=1 Tax=Podospora aff. communis PSN243 TaxID=3040156 RepID=A0AAV9GD35_9PEZI|nr:P-loop containing nucleoside triphosphate hydrolase protein [Podospora aff. communis PSN243]
MDNSNGKRIVLNVFKPSRLKPKSPDKSPTTTTENDTKHKTEPTTDGEPVKCEVKYLNQKFGPSEQKVFQEPKEGTVSSQQENWWKKYAFCHVREYKKHARPEEKPYSVAIYINTKPLKKIIQDVVLNDPLLKDEIDDRKPAKDKVVKIKEPFHQLFFRYKKLESVGRKRFANDQSSLAQLELVLDFARKEFEAEFAAIDRCRTSKTKTIAFEHLWALFPPGEIVYAKILKQECAVRVRRTEVLQEYNFRPGPQLKVFRIHCTWVDFDGENIGMRNLEVLKIDQYQDELVLSELIAMPLDMHEKADKLRAQLLARGRRFERFVGRRYMEYDGPGIKFNTEVRAYEMFSVRGRVMVDPTTFHRLQPNHTFRVGPKITDLKGLATSKLSDQQALIASPRLRGYSFNNRCFVELSVDKMEPVEYDPHCFEGLVLGPAIKRTIQALVTTRARRHEDEESEDDLFDDIIKGKGKGVVCMLHGPPGVGKTLTAECVAEYVKRPLCMVSSGDLGDNAAVLDISLRRIMDLAATWKAVLLIDEADVLMERRDGFNLSRNSMVSVFLRHLEYYKGILFLTTNRVLLSFDEAFKSRIHIPIRYNNLSRDSRRQIWQQLCERVPSGVELTKQDYDTLARHNLNGRQIKNIIKAAESVAEFEGAKVDLKQLQQIAKMQAVFAKDMASLGGVDYNAGGENYEWGSMFN